MKEIEKPEGASPPPTEVAGMRFPRYRRLRRNAIILTTLVALTPLAILTRVNYLQDEDAFRAESRYEVSRILSDTKRMNMDSPVSCVEIAGRSFSSHTAAKRECYA